MHRIVPVALLLLLAVAFAPLSAGGAVFNVKNSGELQQALDRAAGNSENDVVVVRPGVYLGDFRYSSGSAKNLVLLGDPSLAGPGGSAGSRRIIVGTGATNVLRLQDSAGGTFVVAGFTFLSPRQPQGITLRSGGDVASRPGSDLYFLGNLCTGGITEIRLDARAGTVLFLRNALASPDVPDAGKVTIYSTGGTVLFYDNLITGNSAAGINVKKYDTSCSGKRVVFSGNEISGNEGLWLEFFSTCDSGLGDSMVFADNTVSGNNSGQALRIWSNMERGAGGSILFSGNSIHGNVLTILNVHTSTEEGTGGDLSLLGNTFAGNSGGGIRASTGTDSGTGGLILFSGNEVRQNRGGSGVDLNANFTTPTDNGGDITVEYNIVHGNLGFGTPIVQVISASYGAEGEPVPTGKIVARGNEITANTSSGTLKALSIISDTYFGPTGAVTVEDNTVTDNLGPGGSAAGVNVRATSRGGGDSGDLRIVSNEVSRNSGDGIYLNFSGYKSEPEEGMAGSVLVEDNRVTDNADTGIYLHADTPRAGGGGVTLRGNTASGNHAGFDIFREGPGELIIEGNVVADNGTCLPEPEGFGGITVGSKNTAGGVVFAENLVFGNCSDYFSEVVRIYSETGEELRMVNNVIAGNTSPGTAVELYRAGIEGEGRLYMTNNTITGNAGAAGAEGREALKVVVGSSSVELTNNIIGGNDAERDLYLPGTTTNASGYHNVYGTMEGEWSDSGGNLDVDCLFADPEGRDFHLLAGSPCIDAGTDVGVVLPATDFEGDPRIVDGDYLGGAEVDIGADEHLP